MPVKLKQRNSTTYAAEELRVDLVRDMSWQTNLEDPERERCLAWAADRFEQCVSQARTQARSTLRTVNEILGKPDMNRADVINAFLGET